MTWVLQLPTALLALGGLVELVWTWRQRRKPQLEGPGVRPVEGPYAAWFRQAVGDVRRPRMSWDKPVE